MDPERLSIELEFDACSTLVRKLPVRGLLWKDWEIQIKLLSQLSMWNSSFGCHCCYFYRYWLQINSVHTLATCNSAVICVSPWYCNSRLSPDWTACICHSQIARFWRNWAPVQYTLPLTFALKTYSLILLIACCARLQSNYKYGSIALQNIIWCIRYSCIAWRYQSRIFSIINTWKAMPEMVVL